MVTSVQLVGIVADALSLAPETVGMHLRNIRLAKMIEMKGFGRGAAQMGPLDAARLTLAAVGSAFAKDSVQTVETFGSLPTSLQPPRKRELGELPRLPGPNLEISLAFELRRIKYASGRELAEVYRDDFVEPTAIQQMGLPALLLMSGHGLKGLVRAAVLRQHMPDATSTFTFSTLPGEIVDERQFFAAAGFPSLIQSRAISPSALARIAGSL